MGLEPSEEAKRLVQNWLPRVGQLGNEVGLEMTKALDKWRSGKPWQPWEFKRLLVVNHAVNELYDALILLDGLDPSELDSRRRQIIPG